MITDKIIQLIEKLKHNTTSKLQELQESKVPVVYTMESEVQQTYTLDGQEFVYNGGKLILLIRNLPIYYNLNRSTFTDSMINMVNNKEIHPFLIFLNGKFVKWSNIKLVHDFKDRYIIIENFDLASCYVPSDKTVSMSEMFNNWERFSHNVTGVFPANVNELLKWQYIPSTESVVCTFNSATYIGFISDKKYSDYVHQVTVASADSDDDLIGIVIAFHKDENGKEHTLSAVRLITNSNISIESIGSQSQWAIVYNVNQADKKIISNGTSFITPSPAGGWAGSPRGCTIKIERTEDSVIATTSQFNSNILDISTKLTVDLNSDPILSVFIGEKQYGYSCYSQLNSTFKDISFIDLKDNIISPQAEMVLIPFNVKYKENQISLSTKNIFTFDESGFCVNSITGQCSTVDLDDPYIYYESKYLTPSKIQSTGMNANYKISKVNPLLFKNGKLYTDADMKFYGLNTFLVDNGGYAANNIRYKLFYYIYSNQSKDNILNVPNRSAAISKITGSTTPPSYIEALAEPFDFDFDKDKTYSENVSDALDYILKYNPALLNDIYKDLNKISIVEYTGAYLLSIVDNTGYITMNRGSKSGINYPIILVNGELFKYYHYITYRGNSFTFIPKGILATDIIEIVMFKDINNKILESKLLSSNYDDTYSLDSNINVQDLRIFSNDTYDKMYDVPNSNYLKYPVEFKAEQINDSKINITLKDSYYYDRKLYFASARQFRHFYRVLLNPVSFITLPEEFAYCKNKNNYMVFINGRKLDNIDFQFTKVDKSNPFDDLSLYIGIPLLQGYKVDVFYVPEEMKEVITATAIPTNGNIIIDKTKLPYIFSKELYFVFVNGKKINNSSIIDISSNRTKISTNIKTTSSLAILRHINDDSVINDLFNTSNVYDSTVDSLSATDFNTLYSNGNYITNIEPSIKIGKINNNEITKQVIRDYWLRTITTKVNSDELPDILSYDYEETIPYTTKDSDGNNIIK